MSHSLEVGTSKIKVPVHSVSGEDPLSGSQTAVLLCPHVAEGTRALLGLFYKGIDLIHEGFTLMT